VVAVGLMLLDLISVTVCYLAAFGFDVTALWAADVRGPVPVSISHPRRCFTSSSPASFSPMSLAPPPSESFRPPSLIPGAS
jgi:hypothetical protein